MPNNKNLEAVENLKEKVAKSKSVIFTEYHGLSADQINDLRSKISEAGAEVSVTKNTLLKIALEENKMGSKEIEENLTGPTATIFSYEDAVSPIKALFEFAKELELPKVKAGIIDGVFADASKLEVLSNLPSRDELIAKIVGSLKSPLSGITNVLGGSQRKFVYALSALAEKRSEEN